MCGIVGVYNISEELLSLSELKAMTVEIAHRGPDGEGFYIKDNIALGHKRLAILDTSIKGLQPMSSKDNSWIIVFNGAIYNYLELKQELRSKGCQFISGTDTEVIVEGLSIYGISFLERLNGMFSIGAYNQEEKTLYLSRDRYGIKPLYYYFDGKTFIFASEIKAIIKHRNVKTELNYNALNEYFTFQNTITYQTLFKGIFMLPPANTIKINQDTHIIKHKAWWDFNFSEPDETMSFQDAVEETERLFRQAVVRQLIADVPVGSYLSGGMDSGSITAIASQHIDRFATFTAGFDMSSVTGVESNYDERRDAELIASYFKTEHYEQVIGAGDLKWSLPQLVYHLEDLKVGMSYPNFYIARLASKFVKVALQGTGGDELFGGYPWRYYRIFDSLSQKDFFNNYYNYWQRLVSDEDRSHNFFNKKVLNEIDTNASRSTFERVFTFNSKLKYNTPEQHIQNSLYFEAKTFLPGLLLVGDKLAMASGLEERFPFLDNDLVNFAQKIPVRHKLGNFAKNIKRLDENTYGKKNAYQEFDDGKNVLRKAMRGIIPDVVINRKKQGFSAPDESWYRGENAKYIQDLLLDNKAQLREYINPKYISMIINEHLNKKTNHRLLIWSFMNFEWWLKNFMSD
jgi:asparagine synthase (glutamine-hydrolysing)